MDSKALTRRVLTLACLVLLSPLGFAHRDTALKVNPDGTLDGLPAEYTPASLHVTFSEGSESGGQRILSVTLMIGGNTVVIPGCVTGLLMTRSMKDVEIVASWYHDTPSLPPYLDITFYDPGHERAPSRSGFRLLFNLSTARLLKMEVMVPRGNDSSQDIPVDVSAQCPAAQLEKFWKGTLPAGISGAEA
jgi:hypothetical protein